MFSTPAYNRPRLLPWRIGLLITTVVLCILLVVLGGIEFHAAQKNGRRITEAQVMYMMMGFQKQLRQNRPPRSDVTETLYQTFRAEGVHRVALYDADMLLHDFGKSVVPFSMDRFSQTDTPVELVFVTDTLVHAKITLPSPMHLQGAGRMRNRNRPPQVSTRAVLLELTPREAITLRDRAFRMWLLDIFAACILLGAAIVFWKQTVRQEKLKRQLEKDRQLKALGQMSAVIGHELKNTIASVKGHAQLLAENLAGTDSEQSAVLIASDALYLQELTTQMLDFARTGELKREKVYLDDLAEGAVTFSKAKNVHVVLETSKPTAVIDRHKMQQTLTNLINNAHEAGSTEITLCLKNDTALVIEISDNGPGISEARREKIFDPFFTTRAKGTGLGLAFAKRVVESHGGHIDVQSGENHGSTFVLRIPNDIEAVRKIGDTHSVSSKEEVS